MKTLMKVIIDVSMILLFLVQMAYHLIGNALHEYIGIALFILLILHNILDRKWYQGLWKGKYTPVRAFHTTLNFLLLISCFGLMFSAICLSTTLSDVLHLQAVMLGRKLHMIFTTWSFVLMSMHVGIHGNMMVGIIKKHIKNQQRLYWGIARLIVFVVSVYGLYTFISRGMIQRMFLLSEYAFFDYQESLIFFMSDYIAMMFLFANVAYEGKQLIQKKISRERERRC